MSTAKLRSLALAALMVLSVVAGTVAFSGAATAATNVSITAGNDDAGATGVTYTAEGNVELDNQDTLQHIDVHLDSADVSSVGSGDVAVYVDGNQYQDGFSQFSASNGVVELKLANSRSLSDGDPVKVVVDDVTNPDSDFDANVTLHDTSDDKFQEFADRIDIQRIEYSNLAINETTITVGENIDVSATVDNLAGSESTYNASLTVDGVLQRFDEGTVAGDSSTTAEFLTDFSSVGDYNVGIEGLGPTEVTVTGPLQFEGGSASPDQVSPGETVNNQKIHVVVDGVSADGDTDWHYVEFPNALAGSLSLNSADANATSIESSVTLVDGFDGDGTDDTAKFATSADGEGDIALNLTVDTGVTYPNANATYDIDARTEDSSGDSIEQQGITSVTASTTTISDFTADTTSGRDIAISFDASAQLSTIDVQLDDSSGSTVATLTEGDFTETSSGGTYTYSASTTVSSDGVYTATLTDATDTNGEHAGADNSDTATVDTEAVNIVSGDATPDGVTPGETVSNQDVSVVLEGVSADGDTDWHYVEFPDALASNLSVNSADANATSITSSPNLVDGSDNDGIQDTVRFATSSDATGEIDLTVSVDVAIDSYPNTETTYAVDTRVVDSQTGATTQDGVASIEVSENIQPSDPSDDQQTEDPAEDITVAPPTVHDFDLTANGTDVDVSVEASAELDVVYVEAGGMVDEDFPTSAFSVRQHNGTYVYTADVSTGTAGTFDATLVAAATGTGDGAAGEHDSVTVGLPGDPETGAAAAPPWVGDGSSTHTVSVAVPDAARVTGDTLNNVTIGYSEAFLNASGSVTSVSDDQNVEALTVLSEDGEVKSRMGGTDAVSVNVVSGEVRLDLSDVDSSRKVTLSPGDRVVASIRPVTNPASAGTYRTDIGLHSAAGHSTEVESSVSIWENGDASAVATEVVGPTNGMATLNLSESGVVDALAVGADAEAAGVVSVAVPAERPDAVTDAPGSVVTMLNVSRPDAIEDQEANLSLTLSGEEIADNVSNLTVLRYDRASDDWTRLDTSVVSRSNPTVTLEAHASQTSMFAVSSIDDSSNQQDPSDDQTPSDNETTTPGDDPGTATPTSSDDGTTGSDTSESPGNSGPGFGIAIAVLALLGATLLAVRRRA